MKKVFGVLCAVALALPAAAQEPGDSSMVGVQSAPVPVWVVVEEADGEAGAHHVRAVVVWEDSGLGFRFSEEVLPGELVVMLPKTDEADSQGTCDYASELMEHGSEGYQPLERGDPDCLSPPVEDMAGIEVEHRGAPMACIEADRKDGTEDPTIRFYGCYWAEYPGGG